MATTFKTKTVPIRHLLLDHLNPRIPTEKQKLSPEELLEFIADAYNSIAIGRSVAKYGYFPSEPLIAIPKGKQFIVVEGNRRLAALKLLADPSLAENIDDAAEWAELARSDNNVKKVPVVIVKDRQSVAPIIGYRHIAGIEPWDAFAKARYIASQVDKGLTFEATASEVGERPSDVRSHYRNFRIAEQAKKKGIDTSELVEDFGVFTRAMQSSDVRTFVNAPAPNEVAKGKDPIPTSKVSELSELVGMIFGPKRVIKESRDLNRLGKVLVSPEGVKALREGADLAEAEIAAGGAKAKLVSRLQTILANLTRAKEDIANFKDDDEVKDLVAKCQAALKVLVKEL